MQKKEISEGNLERFLRVNAQIYEHTASPETKVFAKFNDLSGLQLQAIRLIAFHSPCAMGKISKSMGLSLCSVTQLMNRLIDKGYVKRTQCKTDRRLVLAELTVKGQKVINIVSQYQKAVLGDLLGKLTNHEQNQFLLFLERMAENN